MSNWNKKQRAISVICGLIGGIAGMGIANLPFFGSWFVGAIFLMWGVYYYVKGME